jgi:hypothetical protein
MGSSMKDSEGVGKVIGRLMMIADVLAINPSSISLREESFEAGDGDSEVVTTNGVANMSIKENDATMEQSVEANLIRGFYLTKLSHPAHITNALDIARWWWRRFGQADTSTST